MNLERFHDPNIEILPLDKNAAQTVQRWHPLAKKLLLWLNLRPFAYQRLIYHGVFTSFQRHGPVSVEALNKAKEVIFDIKLSKVTRPNNNHVVNVSLKLLGLISCEYLWLLIARHSALQERGRQWSGNWVFRWLGLTKKLRLKLWDLSSRDLQKPLGEFKNIIFLLVSKCWVTALRFRVGILTLPHVEVFDHLWNPVQKYLFCVL